MSKILVLAEKPSVGRDIARVLKCNNKGNGYLEGQKYIVTWALGHLVTLAEPEKYGQKFKSWRIEDLPMLPSPMKIEIIKKTSKQFNSVKKLLNRNDVNQIIIATDAGREGELVARWIIEKASVKKPIKRLWISSVTDKAILDGFKNLKDGKEYLNLYASAVARSEADWIVGINATRALTCKYNAQLSCGRVQTPTIYMIAAREEEIRNFKSKTYYGITAETSGLKMIWHDSKNNDTKTFDKDKCDKIVASLKKKDAKIIEVNKTSKKTYAPLLYDLTELQRDGNKIYGFSAKETLSIMQNLYERHKVLTYPRTDSRYLTDDVVGTLKDRVRACSVGPYAKIASKVVRNTIRGNKNFVNNNKVSDHHAIIPTEQGVFLSDLTDRERKIYDLVVKRFLAILYPPYEYEQTTIKAIIGEETFIFKGKVTISEGWKEIYNNSYEDDDLINTISKDRLAGIKKGSVLRISSLNQSRGETKPPAPFDEAGLLSAMEKPMKYMKNQSKDLIKTIGNTGGLGTVATRADIIEKLFNSFLIEKKGKHIHITSKGKQLLELVPGELKSAVLTAEWEQKLSDISKGKLNKKKFIDDMKEYTKTIVKDIKTSSKEFKHDNLTRTKCPECGKFLLEVNGKKGKMLICPDRECGYKKGVSRVTNARCPNCHKKLELKGEGEGQIFVCRCGYREKLSAFNNRKKENSNRISKKDASRYLDKQKKTTEQPLNTAFADALAKLKLDNK